MSNPDASNLQVVVNLIENAFFKAILPGFLDRAGKGDGKGEGKARTGKEKSERRQEEGRRRGK